MPKKAAVIMGSDSDLPVVRKAIQRLRDWDIEVEAHVMSAHRTPTAAAAFASEAAEKGFGVIIAAAGMAAHLAGVMAGSTILPIIGLPLSGGKIGGVDALYSVVQMPPGVPVATVAVDGAVNAALLAVQILALGEPSLTEKLVDYKKQMADEVRAADQKLLRGEDPR